MCEYKCHPSLYCFLTISLRSSFAPALTSISTTSKWPGPTAFIRGVIPFCNCTNFSLKFRPYYISCKVWFIIIIIMMQGLALPGKALCWCLLQHKDRFGFFTWCSNVAIYGHNKLTKVYTLSILQAQHNSIHRSCIILILLWTKVYAYP